MDNIDLTKFHEDGSFTVKLTGPPGLIATNTLIETLAGFSRSLKAIAAAVDPQFELEVYVDSIAPGSINIGFCLEQLRRNRAAVYAAAAITAVATPGVHRDVIVGLFTSALYGQIRPQEKCEVEIDADNVAVSGSNCHVIIRRQVYDLKPRIDGNHKVTEGIKRALKAVNKDRAVDSVGVGTGPGAQPALIIAREDFDEVLRRLDRTDKRRRSDMPLTVDETVPAIDRQTNDRKVRTELTVIREVSTQGMGQWQFVWEGVEISAPIADAYFFIRLRDREAALRLGVLNVDCIAELGRPLIALRQGDVLDVDLRITQQFLPDAKVWRNHTYTVAKVYSLRRGETQMTIDIPSPIDWAHLPAGNPQLPPA